MELDELVDCLTRSVSGDPWHGPGLGALLADVTPSQALAHPIPEAHSIVELVLHLAAWSLEVRARLLGGEPGLPAIGDWPAPEGDAETAWAAAQRRLEEAHAALLDAVRGLDPARLGEGPTGAHDSDLGTGFTAGAVLLGVAQHTAYHAGQIAILKRAFAQPPRSD